MIAFLRVSAIIETARSDLKSRSLGGGYSLRKDLG
jgi:hypothetical protein